MNALTDAGVLAEDKLFATLDPTSRALTLPDGRKVLLVDTVGLVRRLPHHLVEAFKSTLEEAVSASLILNVCDISSEEYAEHLEVTNNLLHELGCEDKPIISVLNKCDLVPFMDDIPVIGKAVKISALNQKGLDELLETIAKTMPPTRMTVELLFPYNQGGLAAKVRSDSVVLEEEYRADGVYLKAICDIHFLNKIQDYILPTNK